MRLSSLFSSSSSSPSSAGLSRTMPSMSLLLLLATTLPVRVFAGSVLSTDGFASCQTNPTITVQAMDISFNRDTNVVTFDAAGTSTEVQYVMASLSVSAYGKQVYNKTFDPCASNTFVKQLCPVPEGTFAAAGNQTIPAQYASMIPSIAYTIPDLDGQGVLQLISKNTSQPVACIQSIVGNGKTARTKGATYVAVGIAGTALVMSGVGALAGAGHALGGSSSSPGFIETVHWFQSMAMNGMLSVQYPAIYRSFSQNFAFSTGIVPWRSMQIAIDNFRQATGGNLTDNSVAYLENSTIVYTSSGTSTGTISSRSILARGLSLLARGVVSSVNGTTTTIGSSGGSGSTISNGTAAVPHAQQEDFVSGIKGYVEELSVPQANVFMTVLLVFAVIIAAITAGILLFKVILELWALFGNFPKSLTNFRKNYWWLVARTTTQLILLLYGVWVLYCVYQFTKGDSWAAKALAAVTIVVFTLLLVGFTLVIYRKAHQFTEHDASTSLLHGDKETWRKYSLFYADYKKNLWWVFIPAIVYMFAKGMVIAAGDGHGLVQTGGQLIVDGLMMLFLIFMRPYNLRSGNGINITIQVVRVLSVLCILVFVEEFGIAQTTQTVVGLVLIIVQVTLSVVLAVLIAINSIIYCIKMNPHRRSRKEAEKLREAEDLTPMDARNSMLMYPIDTKLPITTSESYTPPGHVRGRSGEKGYNAVGSRDTTPAPPRYRDDASSERAGLTRSAAGMPISSRSRSNSNNSFAHVHREPQLPDIEYRGVAL